MYYWGDNYKMQTSHTLCSRPKRYGALHEPRGLEILRESLPRRHEHLVHTGRHVRGLAAAFRPRHEYAKLCARSRHVCPDAAAHGRLDRWLKYGLRRAPARGGLHRPTLSLRLGAQCRIISQPHLQERSLLVGIRRRAGLRRNAVLPAVMLDSIVRCLGASWRTTLPLPILPLPEAPIPPRGLWRTSWHAFAHGDAVPLSILPRR